MCLSLQRSQSRLKHRAKSSLLEPRGWLDRVVMCLPVYTCCAELPLTCTAGTDRQSHENPAWKTTSQWENQSWLEHLHQGTSGSQYVGTRTTTMYIQLIASLYKILKQTQRWTVPTNDNKTAAEIFFTVLFKSTLFLLILTSSFWNAAHIAMWRHCEREGCPL